MWEVFDPVDGEAIRTVETEAEAIAHCMRLQLRGESVDYNRRGEGWI